MTFRSSSASAPPIGSLHLPRYTPPMNPPTPTPLADLDADKVAETATLIRQGDHAGAVARLANVALRFFSELPIVGALGEEGLRLLFDGTSAGRMKKAVAQVTEETSKLEAAQQVAKLVAELLGEALYGLHQDQQAINAALARLDAQLQSVLAGMAERDHIRQGLVDGGATGVVLEAGQRNAVDIQQDRVTQRGTIGVHVKARPPR